MPITATSWLAAENLISANVFKTTYTGPTIQAYPAFKVSGTQPVASTNGKLTLNQGSLPSSGQIMFVAPTTGKNVIADYTSKSGNTLKGLSTEDGNGYVLPGGTAIYVVENWSVFDATPVQTVGGGAGSPALPFFATIDCNGSPNAETVQVLSWVAGGLPGPPPVPGPDTWVVARGWNATTAGAHNNGAPIFTSLSNAAGFMGGDGNNSCDLGNGTVLWIFDDPLWHTDSGQTRSGFPAAHQAVAIQTGMDPSSATMTWYPVYDKNNHLTSFFNDSFDPVSLEPYFYWVGNCAMVNGKLLITGARVSSAGGHEAGGWAALVDNPTDTPDNWNVIPLPWLWNQEGSGNADLPNYNFAGLMVPGDFFTYIYAINFRHQIYGSRFLSTAVAAGHLWDPSWWAGNEYGLFGAGWVDEDERVEVKKTPMYQGSFALLQSTVHKRAGDGLIQLTGSDTGTSLEYSAVAGTGTRFGPLQPIYTTPTTYGQAITYAAGAHPELQFSGQAGNDVVMCYTPGLSTIKQHPETYLTKFVKVQGL